MMEKIARAALERLRRGEPTARDLARLAAAFHISAESEDDVQERHLLLSLRDALKQLKTF